MAASNDDNLLDHRARLRIREQDLLQLLNLPAGTRIRAVTASSDPCSVDLHIVHPRLEPHPPECEAPYLYGLVEMIDTGRGHLPLLSWDF